MSLVKYSLGLQQQQQITTNKQSDACHSADMLEEMVFSLHSIENVRKIIQINGTVFEFIKISGTLD